MSLSFVSFGLHGTGGGGVAQPATYDPSITGYAKVLEPHIGFVADVELVPDEDAAAVLTPGGTSGVPETELVPTPSVGVELKPDPYSAGEE